MSPCSKPSSGIPTLSEWNLSSFFGPQGLRWICPSALSSQPFSQCSLCSRFCVLFVHQTCHPCSILGSLTCAAPYACLEGSPVTTELGLLHSGQLLRPPLTTVTSVPFSLLMNPLPHLVLFPCIAYQQTVHWSVVFSAPCLSATWEQGFCLLSHWCPPCLNWYLAARRRSVKLVWMNECHRSVLWAIMNVKWHKRIDTHMRSA